MDLPQRKSLRLKGYDYSQNGYYFITIDAKDGFHYFGEIKNAKMVLNEIGKIVDEEIIKTNNIRKEINIMHYCIMPNHIHLIIEIYILKTPVGVCGNKHLRESNKHLRESNKHLRESSTCPYWEGANHLPQGLVATSPCGGSNKGKTDNKTKPNHFWEQKTILGTTVQALKASVTRRVGHPIWHRSYYDEIIRDEDQFINTHNYITLNPIRWEEQKKG